jgi:hypothetical protein
MEKHGPKHDQKPNRSRFSPPHREAPPQEPCQEPCQEPYLIFDYDAVCGRLLVTSTHGGFVIFHGVPIDAYIWLRFSPTPEKYLRERLISEFSFVCSSACWPQT